MFAYNSSSKVKALSVLSPDQLNVICLKCVSGWTYRSHLGFVVAGQENSFLGLPAYMSTTTVGMGSNATLQDGIDKVCPGALKAGGSLDEQALLEDIKDCILWRVWIIRTYQDLNHIHSSCYVIMLSIFVPDGAKYFAGMIPTKMKYKLLC